MARPRVTAIAIATLAIAAIVGSDALARTAARQLPELAAAVPLSNGFAQSRRVGVMLSRAFKPGPEPVLVMSAAQRRRAAELVRRAYRAEPLNHDALRNYALVAEADGRLPQARSLMLAADRVTRRDLATNLWLGRDFGRRGKFEQALSAYDHALRTSSQAQELILPVMIENLKQDALVAPVTALMLKAPPWQNVFWGVAPRYRPSLANLAKVRMAMIGAGVPVDRQYDRVLVAELAGSREFAVGRRLARRLAPGPGDRRETITNHEFAQLPDLKPYDWELSLDSFLTADIAPREGVLRISTFADGSGRVARQVVALPGRVYTLSIKARDWDALDQNALYVRLDCAEEGKAVESRPIYLDRPDFRQGFTKPQADCTYYWLTLYAAVQPQQQNNVVTLDRISLTAGAPRG